jgi:hypothetical protein
LVKAVVEGNNAVLRKYGLDEPQIIECAVLGMAAVDRPKANAPTNVYDLLGQHFKRGLLYNFQIGSGRPLLYVMQKFYLIAVAGVVNIEMLFFEYIDRQTAFASPSATREKNT